MFESIMNFFKSFSKKDEKVVANSKEAAKERLHLVLMQDRANVSADFLELMKQEIIEVIKKYIEVDEGAIDVRLTNKENEDGTNGAPALYANIPILNIKNDAKKVDVKEEKGLKQKQEKKIEKLEKKEEKQEESKEESKIEKLESEEVKEIHNERIAQAIIDGKINNLEKSSKKENKEEKETKETLKSEK